MISHVWRERLTYTVMSLFVAWHTLALVLAPAPISVTSLQLRVLLKPYLSLLRLDNPWNFFAPYFGSMQMSRFGYTIEDKDGKSVHFYPEEEFGWFSPSYFWFRGWYNEIIDKPEDYAGLAGAMYCRKHAALQPVSVTLLDIQEKVFSQDDFLAGKQRWDPEFLTVNTIKRVTCPAE
jgi:hypothetical protein